MNQLGTEAFGILTLIWALISYFSLFDFGVGRALTIEIGKLNSNAKRSDVACFMRADLLLTLGSGLLGGLIMWFVAPYLAGGWLNISPAFQNDAQQAQLAAFGGCVCDISQWTEGVQEGLEKFRSNQYQQNGYGLMHLLFPSSGDSSAWTFSVSDCDLSGSCEISDADAECAQLHAYWWGISGCALKDKIKMLFGFGSWVTLSRG